MLCRLTAKNQAFNSMNQASATQHTGWSVKPDPLCHVKNYAGHQAFQQCVACLWLEIHNTAVGAVQVPVRTLFYVEQTFKMTNL